MHRDLENDVRALVQKGEPKGRNRFSLTGRNISAKLRPSGASTSKVQVLFITVSEIVT